MSDRDGMERSCCGNGVDMRQESGRRPHTKVNSMEAENGTTMQGHKFVPCPPTQPRSPISHAADNPVGRHLQAARHRSGGPNAPPPTQAVASRSHSMDPRASRWARAAHQRQGAQQQGTQHQGTQQEREHRLHSQQPKNLQSLAKPASTAANRRGPARKLSSRSCYADPLQGQNTQSPPLPPSLLISQSASVGVLDGLETRNRVRPHQLPALASSHNLLAPRRLSSYTPLPAAPPSSNGMHKHPEAPQPLKQIKSDAVAEAFDDSDCVPKGEPLVVAVRIGVKRVTLSARPDWTLERLMTAAIASLKQNDEHRALVDVVHHFVQPAFVLPAGLLPSPVITDLKKTLSQCGVTSKMLVYLRDMAC